MELTIGSMCTGYAGLDMAVQEVLGGRVVWHAENDPDASKVLAHRYPDIPNLGDITKVDWAEVGRPDVVCAGFPCTDISYAGPGAGILEGNRSGLWYPIARAIGVLRPRLLVLENVDRIVVRRPGLDVVLESLARLGFDAVWTCLPASGVGGAHERWRWICLAWPAERAGGLHAVAGAAGAPVRVAVEPVERLFPTPTARDWKSGASNLLGTNARPLNEVVVNLLGHSVAGSWKGGDGLDFGPAVRRWERVTGRRSPSPTEAGPKGGCTLAPRFTEWLMGLPAGWVTDVPGINRDARLRILGNGVVPQQAAEAIRFLLGAIPGEATERMCDTRPLDQAAAEQGVTTLADVGDLAAGPEFSVSELEAFADEIAALRRPEVA